MWSSITEDRLSLVMLTPKRQSMSSMVSSDLKVKVTKRTVMMEKLSSRPSWPKGTSI